jgi:hypothetical protein
VHCVTAGLRSEGERFQMCIHNEHEDVHVSGSILRDGVWEGHVLGRFVRILKRFPNAGVLDVGAQLGMYGLQAAKMNHPVRPFSLHVFRSFIL